LQNSIYPLIFKAACSTSNSIQFTYEKKIGPEHFLFAFLKWQCCKMYHKNANLVVVYNLRDTQQIFTHTHNAFKANATPKLDGRILLNKITHDLDNRKLISKV